MTRGRVTSSPPRFILGVAPWGRRLRLQTFRGHQVVRTETRILRPQIQAGRLRQGL